MASTDKPADPEVPPPPPPRPAPSPCWKDCFAVDVALRVLLLAAAITAVVVMVTSNQTKPLSSRDVKHFPVPIPDKLKFNHSPAFIYFVAALSVAGLYSIITIIASVSVILKPVFSKKFLLHFAFWDLLILGVVASAVGAAGAIAYSGLKGSSHLGWNNKVCSVYDRFCKHLAASLAVALFAAVLLALLSILSILSLHKRIRD
ncbi:hypothetical protein SLA2020_485650 [Shorea laevis]